MYLEPQNPNFQRFCCVHDRFKEAIVGEMESLEQMHNATKVCFNDLNMTDEGVVYSVFNIILGSTKLKEDDCQPTSSIHVGYICLWVFIMITILSANFFVIIAVNRVAELRKNFSNFFIMSLAATDFFVGLFIVPVKILFAYNNLNLYSQALCRFYITTDTALFSTSVSTLIVISIDRYLIITYPYKHQRWLTMLRCKLMIACVWIYGGVWGLMSNMNWHDLKKPSILINSENNCVINENPGYVATVYVVVFYIPVIILFFTYLNVLSIARNHAREISRTFSVPITTHADDETQIQNFEKSQRENPNEASVTTTLASSQVRRNKRGKSSRVTNMKNLRLRQMTIKATRSVVAVYGTFIFCWLPVSVFSFAVAFKKTLVIGSEVPAKWFYHIFVEVLPVVNSMLNPFLYAFMNKDYRKAYKLILKRFWNSLTTMDFCCNR